ncbi:glycosyltransferase family 61 protein [Paenibacillus lautus]|uniref:glycosyltransferase family 61 protein n=1 Tax=Paenibacillus lautus TaxID=1401 RepID=UPI003D2BC037
MGEAFLPKRVMETASAPVGYYPNLLDWVQASGLNREKHFRELYNSYSFEYKDASSLGKTPPPQFQGGRITAPTANVAVIPSGRVWGMNGAVLSQDNMLLSDVSIEFYVDTLIKGEKHPALHDWKPFPLVNTSETVAALTFGISQNYFHWLFDVLPRLHLIQLSGLKPSKYVLNRTVKMAFQDETLNMVGIPAESRLETHAEFHLQADNLIVPSLIGTSSFSYYPKWVCDYLRSVMLPHADEEVRNGPERIYVSRARAETRRIKNEQEVMERLSAKGFVCVELESMTVRQQIRLFRSAKWVVAPHGAGLTNLVFCEPGTKVLELFTPNYMPRHYWLISNHCGLDYWYLTGTGDGREGDWNLVENMFINVEELSRTLSKMGVDTRH